MVAGFCSGSRREAVVQEVMYYPHVLHGSSFPSEPRIAAAEHVHVRHSFTLMR